MNFLSLIPQRNSCAVITISNADLIHQFLSPILFPFVTKTWISMKIVDLFVGRTINQLPVFDECIRHEEMGTLCYDEYTRHRLPFATHFSSTRFTKKWQQLTGSTIISRSFSSISLSRFSTIDRKYECLFGSWVARKFSNYFWHRRRSLWSRFLCRNCL